MDAPPATYAPYGQACPLYDIAAATAGGFVLEDEIFVTTRCESARLRLAIVSIWFAVYALVMLVALVFLVVPWARPPTARGGKHEWNARATAIAFVGLCAAGRVICFGLGIAYKFSWLYQLLMGLPLGCIAAATTIMLENWIVLLLNFADGNLFGASGAITHRLRVALIVFNLLFTGGACVFWTAGSAMRFDPERYPTYNLLMALGYLWIGVMGIGLGVGLFVAGWYLTALLLRTTRAVSTTGSADERMKTVVQKVKSFTWTTLLASIIACSGCIAVFIWWAAVQSVGGTMGYFFFVMYFIILPCEAMGCAALLYLLRPAAMQRGPSTGVESGETSSATGKKAGGGGGGSGSALGIGERSGTDDATAGMTPAMLLLGAPPRLIVETRVFN